MTAESTEDRCQELGMWTLWEEKEEREVSFNDRRVRLTVGHTLILDLQVFVGSWAGVRENI